MRSLRELYRIGRGPSSSHTMAPAHAAEEFARLYPQAVKYRAVLYGSLAQTGRGHGTDCAVAESLGGGAEIVFSDGTDIPHPNTMDLFALDGNGQVIGARRVLSTGGGAFCFLGESEHVSEVYPQRTLAEIAELCRQSGRRLYEYAEAREGRALRVYMQAVWKQMKETIRAGLCTEGELPGGLHVLRRAPLLFRKNMSGETEIGRENRLISAYAFAAAEQNAGGGIVVTAPTCGSCGVVPAVLLYMQERCGFSDERICAALETAGIFGNIIKTNASISGAECGCQAEIGTACCMAAAALCELHECSLACIECAAEMAVEHHLGLTCDPVGGYVQIPCIERNAMAALDAVNVFSLSRIFGEKHKVGFDLAVGAMYETGKDLSSAYRETAKGGLAKLYSVKK